MTAVFVIGDVHGHLDKLLDLLRGAELITTGETWTGGDSTLWFIGDLVDRGPDGIGVVELVMRLQREAATAGGAVHALLGNHDLLLVAAARFGGGVRGGPDAMFRAVWEANGGRAQDLARLQAGHGRWLTSLPAMALAEDHLLVHADSLGYARYGQTIGDVNQAVARVLQCDDRGRWDRLLRDISDRFAFSDGLPGVASAKAMLSRFGGLRIVHGHTPISIITNQPAATVRAPYLYANGCCLNVDGGIFLGGPGFVYRLPAAVATEER